VVVHLLDKVANDGAFLVLSLELQIALTLHFTQAMIRHILNSLFGVAFTRCRHRDAFRNRGPAIVTHHPHKGAFVRRTEAGINVSKLFLSVTLLRSLALDPNRLLLAEEVCFKNALPLLGAMLECI